MFKKHATINSCLIYTAYNIRNSPFIISGEYKKKTLLHFKIVEGEHFSQ